MHPQVSAPARTAIVSSGEGEIYGPLVATVRATSGDDTLQSRGIERDGNASDRKPVPRLQSRRHEIPGSKAVVAFRLEHVDDQRAERLRDGDDPAARPVCSLRANPSAFETVLAVPLENSRRDHNRIHLEQVHGGGPLILHPVDLDAMCEQARNEIALRYVDCVRVRRGDRPGRLEAIVDRDPERTEAAGATEARRHPWLRDG